MKDKWRLCRAAGIAALLCIGAAGLYLDRPRAKLEITVQKESSFAAATVENPAVTTANTTTTGVHTTDTTHAKPTAAASAGTEPPANFSQEHDLNLATAEDLKRVEGIGDALAAAIISAREACGGFTSRQQICEISGIGTKLMQRIMTEFEIRDEITEPEQPEPLPEQSGSETESSAEDPYYINVYDLNTVTREQLLTIPEMTEAKADAILAMRGELKGYYSVYELTLADGISGEYFEQVLSRCLYVEGDPNSHPAGQELPEN